MVSVVAIGRLDHVVAPVELHAHLAEIVAEDASRAQAERRIAEVACGLLLEQRAALRHEPVWI